MKPARRQEAREPTDIIHIGHPPRMQSRLQKKKPGPATKNLLASAGDATDAGVIPGLGRSPGVGNGSPLQHSCLENPMDRGAWWLLSIGWKSQTQLSH